MSTSTEQRMARLAALDESEIERLVRAARFRASPKVSRRRVLQAGAAAAFGTFGAGGVAADHNDNNPDVGQPDDRLDIFADVIDVGESVEGNTLASAPTPPQSGEYALYFRDDARLYKQNAAGNEQAIGGSATGAGAMAPTYTVAASDAVSQAGADYVCDGTDDDVEINDAISDLPASGGSISLTEGTYHITTPIGDPARAQVNNVFFFGNGLDSTRIRVEANINGFDLHDPQGWAIRDLEIDGNRANNGDANNRENQNGIYVRTGADFYLQSVYIHDTVYNSFRAANSAGDGEGRNFRIVNNRMVDTDQDPSDIVADNISFAGRFTDGATYRGGVIANNYLENCGNTGIEVAYVEGFISQGNVIYEADARGLSHHDSNSGENPPNQANIIRGNVMVDCNQTHANGVIHMEAKDGAVLNNIIQDSPSADFGIQTIERPGYATKTICSHNMIRGIDGHGLDIRTDNTIIIGNTAENITGDGAKIQRGNASLVVANNLGNISDSGTNTLIKWNQGN